MTGLRVPEVEAFIAGHGRLAMPRSLAFLSNRWAAPDAVTGRNLLWIASLAAIYICAVALMASTENSVVGAAVFLLTWGVVNFFWLVLLRRPAGLGCAVVGHDRSLGSSVAAQIRHHLDDGELP